MGRPAAFFDFDKTLLDTESSKLLIRYMSQRRRIFFSRKRVSLVFLARLLIANEFYKRDRYSDERMGYLLLRFFRGRDPALFESNGADFYHSCLKPRLAPNLLAHLEGHRQKGDVLVLLSAGLRFSLRHAAKDLGFDHLLCTDLEVGPDGCFTGRPRGSICIDVHKRTMARQLADTQDIDLASSTAYGNHHSDIPLLETVGRPVAVEPTGPLSRVAAERDWPVLRYR